MGKIELVMPFFKSVLPKTGTKIEKGIYDATGEWGKRMGNEFGSNIYTRQKGVTKLITYGENTPMAKYGCDQVAISSFPSGKKQYLYFRDGKKINEVSLNKDGKISSYQKGNYMYSGLEEEKSLGEHLRPFFDTLKQFLG